MKLVAMISDTNLEAELSKKINITCSNSLTTMTLSIRAALQSKIMLTMDKRMVPMMDKRMVSMAKALRTSKKARMRQEVKVKARMKRVSRYT